MMSLIELSHLEFIDSRLRDIFLEAQDFLGTPFVITSLYRIDDPGVHGALPLRGIDARCKYPRLGEPVVEYVNSRWSYDHSRPKLVCCMAHDPGQGFHLHFQTHPKTKRILMAA